MKYVAISAKVAYRIESLKKSGKAGNVLAQKATRIIENLISGDMRHFMNAVGSYTKYGEKRIKNCRKYDMGCGYRLITVQRGLKIFIPFMGTHDECQRWLENNSRLKEVVVGSRTLFRFCHKSQPPENLTNPDSADLGKGSEDEVLLELSDKDLRHVFSGLVEGAKKQRQQA
jgi:hypothetical protein